MINLLLIIVGFLLLISGANLLVDSSSALASRFNIPNIVIGLTIVAFGTSSPELIVNIIGSLNKSSEIVLGNVLGSNIFNVLGILGLSAILYPLTVKTNTTWIEIPLCALSAIVVFVLSNDILIDNAADGFISRTDGIILLLFFVVFVSYNIKLSKSGNMDEEIEIKKYTISRALTLLLSGFILLLAGGKVIVESASDFARFLGISERIIALTIVSIGTSLPELATSLMAVKKRNVDLAIGNIVGSNIFNIFFILGVSSTLYPVSVNKSAINDMIVNMGISLLLFLFIFTGKGRRLERWEGIILISVYIAYLLLLVL